MLLLCLVVGSVLTTVQINATSRNFTDIAYLALIGLKLLRWFRVELEVFLILHRGWNWWALILSDTKLL